MDSTVDSTGTRLGLDCSATVAAVATAATAATAAAAAPAAAAVATAVAAVAVAAATAVVAVRVQHHWRKATTTTARVDRRKNLFGLNLIVEPCTVSYTLTYVGRLAYRSRAEAATFAY